MAPKQIDDCFLHDKDRLTHKEALNILKTNLSPLHATDTININEADNRVLAEDIRAPRPIPAHRNAAVDGYAFAYDEYSKDQGTTFPVSERVIAGAPLIEATQENSTTRIFTGAVMPSDLDTVVMQEDVTLKETPDGQTSVSIPPGLKQGANCRQAGEDTAENSIIVEKQTKLTSRHIAAIASAGIDELLVHQKPKVAILSTGNEILSPGDEFHLGKVYDSNRPMLKSLIKSQQADLTDLGIIKDNPGDIQNALMEAAKTHDVIITSGGASKGEEDHIITSLQNLGKQHMWQLAIKPGRPMSFGQINDTLFIGLPGNPVAAFICFFLYGIPIINRLSGQEWQSPHKFQVLANFEILKKKPDRREFLRGTLRTENGITSVDKFNQDGSGIIRSLTTADGLIEIDEATTSVNKGDLVTFIPFTQNAI
ncbi:MAG: molybdopterin molybdotransferase MoeA [Rhodomicrobiaceae bacterium]